MMNQSQLSIFRYRTVTKLLFWSTECKDVKLYSLAYEHEGLIGWFNTSKRSCRFSFFAIDLSKVKEDMNYFHLIIEIAIVR